jgi:hypothetical protein
MMNRQKMALAFLLVLFALALAYSFMGRPKQRSVKKLKYTPGMRIDSYRAITKVQDDKKLRLELLDREMPRFAGFRRNIFRPVFSEEMKLAAISLKPLKPAPPAPPPPPPPPVQKTPAQVAMEEVGQFAFLGYLQKENRKTVFLTKNNEIFLVKKGDRIIGKYEVADISENMMTIALAPGGEQVAIPLQQNRPLGRGTAPTTAGRR